MNRGAEHLGEALIYSQIIQWGLQLVFRRALPGEETIYSENITAQELANAADEQGGELG